MLARHFIKMGEETIGGGAGGGKEKKFGPTRPFGGAIPKDTFASLCYRTAGYRPKGKRIKLEKKRWAVRRSTDREL